MHFVRIAARCLAFLIVLAAVPTGATGQAIAPAVAQDNARWLGAWFNVHYTYSSGTSMDANPGFVALNTTTSSSSGGGFGFGYTIVPWFGLFLNADVAPGQTITSTTVTGTQTLYQVDAGVRAQVPMVTIPLLFYAELGVSSRFLSGTAQVQGLSPEQGNAYDTWGGAVTYGFGAQYLVGRAVAVDVSYLASSGTYGDVKIANIAPLPSHASSSGSSRVLIGLNWFPGR